MDKNTNQVAIEVFDAFYRDVVSDDYKCYEPGDDTVFYLHHSATGKRFRIEVLEETSQKEKLDNINSLLKAVASGNVTLDEILQES